MADRIPDLPRSQVVSRRTLVIMMEDKPGVLSHVSNLFRRRNFNIESLTVGHTETPGISRMTAVVMANDAMLEQITKQLHKLINVTKINAVEDQESVVRELALLKVYATPANRAEIKQLVDIFRAQIINVGADSMVVEITGTEDKVDSLIEMLRPYGIKELTRTGRVAMLRGTVRATGGK